MTTSKLTPHQIKVLRGVGIDPAYAATIAVRAQVRRPNHTLALLMQKGYVVGHTRRMTRKQWERWALTDKGRHWLADNPPPVNVVFGPTSEWLATEDDRFEGITHRALVDGIQRGHLRRIFNFHGCKYVFVPIDVAAEDMFGKVFHPQPRDYVKAMLVERVQTAYQEALLNPN